MGGWEITWIMASRGLEPPMWIHWTVRLVTAAILVLEIWLLWRQPQGEDPESTGP